MMLKMVWEYIMGIFGITKTNTTGEQMQENMAFTQKYEAAEEMNFTAIFANKLSTLAMNESTADVSGDNGRVIFLDQCLIEVWDRMKRVVSRMLGTGGCIVVPYVRLGIIQFDVLSQERMVIHEKQGNRITRATVLADSVKQGEKQYHRWMDYQVAGGNLYITNKVTDQWGNAAFLEQWAEIEDIAIAGVDRVLFAYFQSPIDNRRFTDEYGVPITYGCDNLISEIFECLEQIRDEYKLKEVKIFADERMFQKDAKTGKYRMPSKVFFAAHGKENGDMIEVFSPEIRHSSYYERLQYLFGLLEKSIGTSKGILTAPQSRGATATEIKAGLYDTFALIGDIRNAIERGVRDYLYACNVLANYYELAPMGSYGVRFDWSYEMIESSSETWEQLKDALELGVKSKVELRQWLNPNETSDEAQKVLEEIKERQQVGDKQDCGIGQGIKKV
ncbi:phage portal protein [Anaerotignum propionicum]|uniref:phage portal protein n=1 Tax=Anaerotignum propionicum TaxID=28446 RepID=UPI0021099C6A|nr:phage portal protein [Anaerotignum propionicum]MCQ4936854.1 phage portal protein [Anaerotignum propionicum]